MPCLLCHSLLAAAIPDELAEVGNDDGGGLAGNFLDLVHEVNGAAGTNSVGADEAVG